MHLSKHYLIDFCTKGVYTRYLISFVAFEANLGKPPYSAIHYAISRYNENMRIDKLRPNIVVYACFKTLFDLFLY